MQNVFAEVQGNKLVLTVDLSQSLGQSQSGKSELVASTGGGAALTSMPEVKINLTVYRPVKKPARY